MNLNPLRATPHATLAGTAQVDLVENSAPLLLPAVAVYPGASTGRGIAKPALLEDNPHQPAQPTSLENLLLCFKRVRQEHSFWEGMALGVLWLSGLWGIVISFAGR